MHLVNKFSKQSSLVDKSDDIVDIRGNTSSNRACAWSRHAFLQLFPTTQQSHTFTKPLRTSPIAASGATKVKMSSGLSTSAKPLIHPKVWTSGNTDNKKPLMQNKFLLPF